MSERVRTYRERCEEGRRGQGVRRSPSPGSLILCPPSQGRSFRTHPYWSYLHHLLGFFSSLSRSYLHHLPHLQVVSPSFSGFFFSSSRSCHYPFPHLQVTSPSSSGFPSPYLHFLLSFSSLSPTGFMLFTFHVPFPITSSIKF